MTTTSPAALVDLAIGDRVAIKRNLTHPANMMRGAYCEYNGARSWIPDPAKAAQEDLGTGTVIERRKDFYGKIMVRVSNGFWYDVVDGYQDGAQATIIEVI